MAAKRPKKEQKSTEVSTETKPETGTLIPQPHGGALRYGGTSKGGTGRPPEAFRRLARNLLKKRELLPRLADIADASIGEIHKVELEGGTIKVYTETPIREQRGAIEALVKIGIPQVKEMSTEQVREILTQQIAVIRNDGPLKVGITPQQAEAILDLIEPLWR